MVSLVFPDAMGRVVVRHRPKRLLWLAEHIRTGDAMPAASIAFHQAATLPVKVVSGRVVIGIEREDECRDKSTLDPCAV
jgi:hypothetical protein